MSSLRELTVNKIARSIEDAWTPEQLTSTEQFMALYYSRFDFQTTFLSREWGMDNAIREKKQLLTALEGAQSIVFSALRPSLKRLDAYCSQLSYKEFVAEWEGMRGQLAGIGAAEISLYPQVCQLLAKVQSLTPAVGLVEVPA